MDGNIGQQLLDVVADQRIIGLRNSVLVAKTSSSDNSLEMHASPSSAAQIQ